MKEKHRKFWDKTAVPETFLRSVHPRTMQVRELVLESAKTLFSGSLENVKVLDVACGPGIDAEMWQKQGAAYTGIDFTQKFVDFAKNQGLNVFKMDAKKIDFPKNCFEFVYCKDLLEHLPPGDHKKVLQEMWRVTRGFMAVSFFRPPGAGLVYPDITSYHTVTEEENPETAGCFSHTYGRGDLREFVMKELQPNPKALFVRDNLALKPSWNEFKGFSLWILAKRRDFLY